MKQVYQMDVDKVFTQRKEKDSGDGVFRTVQGSAGNDSDHCGYCFCGIR